MCLIIDKPAGKKLERGVLERSLSRNPDGWGLMYADAGSIIVHKGLLPTEFLRIAYSIPKTAHVVYHHRLATHGSKTMDNCHPFPVTDDIYMMHNGILGITTTLEHDKTDSYHFARYVLRPMLMNDPSLFGTARFADLIESLIDKDKIVLLRADGACQRIGEGVERKGLWYSNEYSFRDYAIRFYDKSGYASYNYADSYYSVSRSREDEKEAVEYAPWEPNSFGEMLAMDAESLAEYLNDSPEEAATIILSVAPELGPILDANGSIDEI